MVNPNCFINSNCFKPSKTFETAVRLKNYRFYELHYLLCFTYNFSTLEIEFEYVHVSLYGHLNDFP